MVSCSIRRGTARESYSNKQASFTKANGKTTSSMEEAMSPTPTAHSTKGTMSTGNQKESESLFGRMEKSTKVNGRTEKSTEAVSGKETKETPISVNGNWAKQTVAECIYGLMVTDSKENSETA